MEQAQILELVGQGLGVLIILLSVISAQMPKRWQILLTLAGVNLLTVFNQLLVGDGFAVALGCAVATVHCPINAYKAKKKLPTRVWENVVWSLLYFGAWGVGLYLAAGAGTLSFMDAFPFFGTVTFLLSVFLPKERDVRIFTFANSFVYFIYNVINLNVAAASQLLTMISVVIALVRYRKKKKTMKILFVFTGGTIGSTQKDNVISADESKPYKIIDAYAAKHGISFDYDVAEPYTELSENNTGDTIKSLVACVKAHLSDGYDGMIVTHGTDTLQYSAAAIGYCVGLDTLPICLVSANAPIEDPASNALDNLHGAIRFIKAGAGKGAFVVYRNGDSDTVKVHRATRLIGSMAYSDAVSSVMGGVYGYFGKDFTFVKSPDYKEAADAVLPLDASVLEETNNAAMLLFSYPGMRYPHIDEDVRYILLGSFHSGTVNTKSQDATRFFKTAKARGIPVYVTGVSEGPQYESAELFKELGIIPICNLSPVSAYVKLWLISSAGLPVDKYLDASLSGDKV